MGLAESSVQYLKKWTSLAWVLISISGGVMGHEGNHPEPKQKMPEKSKASSSLLKQFGEQNQTKKTENLKSEMVDNSKTISEEGTQTELESSNDLVTNNSKSLPTPPVPSIIVPALGDDSSGSNLSPGSTFSSSSSSGPSISPPEGEPEEANEKAKKELTDLVDRANKNVETSVASTPEEAKNGAFNPDDGITSLSSITYHTNNDAICLKSRGNGKPDGAVCEQWLDKEISDHGTAGDSSPLERKFYELWEKAKDNISQGAYRIWDIALKAKENLLDSHGRLNMVGLSKFELNKEAKEVAAELGTKSAEQALRNSLGNQAPKDGEVVAPPPEALRALAVNISRGIVNHATSKWAQIQIAKEGVEILTNVERDAQKYKSEVEKGDNIRASGEERLLNQAPLDPETVGISLDERAARAQALKQTDTRLVNPSFEGDKVVSGGLNRERIDEFAYRATVEQMANPFKNTSEIERSDQIQISERQIASEIAVGSDSEEEQEQKVTLKSMTPKAQIEAYNRQLEIAARNMEAIAAESSSFVNTGSKIRANKLKEGETVLTINDLTPAQKQEINSGSTPLAQNPNTKVEIPRAASQLSITRY
ncbi:MAG: hypothetical protein ACKOA8_10145 [Deltaproteobacteria bacterium]